MRDVIILCLTSGFIGGIVGSIAEWRRNRAEIKEAWDRCDEQRKRAWAAEDRLRSVSGCVNRALACGQLEKLDDAKRYLDGR